MKFVWTSLKLGENGRTLTKLGKGALHQGLLLAFSNPSASAVQETPVTAIARVAAITTSAIATITAAMPVVSSAKLTRALMGLFSASIYEVE